MPLDTLARLYAESGDLDQAIRWQEEAVKFSEGNDKAIVEEIKQTLDTYKSSNAP